MYMYTAAGNRLLYVYTNLTQITAPLRPLAIVSLAVACQVLRLSGLDSLSHALSVNMSDKSYYLCVG